MEERKLYKLDSSCWALREVKGVGFGNTDIDLHQQGRVYKILAKDCKLPDDDDNRQNDTIIMDVCNGDIFYVKEKYLVSVDCLNNCSACNYCPNCGAKIRRNK